MNDIKSAIAGNFVSGAEIMRTNLTMGSRSVVYTTTRSWQTIFRQVYPKLNRGAQDSDQGCEKDDFAALKAIRT